MVALTNLLVLALAIATNALSVPNCQTVKSGSAVGSPISLKPTILPAGVPDLEVNIQIPLGCVMNGLSIVVCDDTGIPTIIFREAWEIIVQRTGPYIGIGSVNPTVYCNDGPNNHDPLPHSLDHSSSAVLEVTPQTAWGQSTQKSCTSCEQSPLLGLTAQSLPGHTHHHLIGQTPQNVWNQTPSPLFRRSAQPLFGHTSLDHWDQSTLPLLGATPQQWGQASQASWNQSPLGVTSQQPLLGHSSQLWNHPSSLLTTTPQPVWNQIPNSYDQSVQPLWSQPLQARLDQSALSQCGNQFGLCGAK